jgi:hypothetical protein
LRAALRRAKATGHGLAIELEAVEPVAQNLVKPEPNSTTDGQSQGGGSVTPISAEPAG